MIGAVGTCKLGYFFRCDWQSLSAGAEKQTRFVFSGLGLECSQTHRATVFNEGFTQANHCQVRFVLIRGGQPLQILFRFLRGAATTTPSKVHFTGFHFAFACFHFVFVLRSIAFVLHLFVFILLRITCFQSAFFCFHPAFVCCHFAVILLFGGSLYQEEGL